MCPDFVDKLRKFSSTNKLKKAVLHIIAGHLDDKQIQSLRDTFHHLDENGDGLLSLQEIVTGLQKAEMPSSPADLHDIMEQIDSDGSGLVDYTEFLAATLNQRTYMQEDAPCATRALSCNLVLLLPVASCGACCVWREV